MSKIRKLVGRDGMIYETDVMGTLGGHKGTKVYGQLETCPSANAALKRNPESYKKSRVFFADQATAIAAGFRPCGACMKPEYAIWKAKQAG